MALSACAAQGGPAGGSGSASAEAAANSTYTAPAGWTAQIPSGWQELSFQTADGQASSEGVQISNVTLPPPTIALGYLIQVNSRDLPDDGIALIVATDEDPNLQQAPSSVAAPPLDMSMFTFGSAPGGAPTLDTLWFSGNGEPYLASVKTGPGVSHEDEAALRAIVASLRFDGAS
jgi:hypothetical protein